MIIIIHLKKNLCFHEDVNNLIFIFLKHILNNIFIKNNLWIYYNIAIHILLKKYLFLIFLITKAFFF